ncbi:MAG: DegV family protein [Oscillospiraceae bacterium]|nr:DegV family protein [Oscillospiraceae bacterium]MBR4194994.1 DegV family protein [Oscillospiraceae bacterium]
MSDYVIITDSSCDLSPELLEQWEVPFVSLSYKFDEDPSSHGNFDLPFDQFYERMRKGSVARTAAANMETFRQAFEPWLKDGKDLLYIGFSSGLSTTVNSGAMAARELMEEYPERKILVEDTYAASAGFGLLVYLTVQEKRRGATLEEAAKFVEDNRFHLCHWFTVDDLVYLKRGGRVSAAAAFAAGLLNIKPVLHMDDPGHLINMFKVRGRRASIKALADKYGELAIHPGPDDTVFISHGDCVEDAKLLEKMLAERFGAKVQLITYVGPVIGSHSGPGTLALFFLGRER